MATIGVLSDYLYASEIPRQRAHTMFGN